MTQLVVRAAPLALAIGIFTACGASKDEEAVGKTNAAITFGSPDTTHPEVGALNFFSTSDPTVETFLGLCTGVLIAPRVFLTAAHCRPAPDWFSFVGFGANLYETFATGGLIRVEREDFIAHPSFPGAYSSEASVMDIGVVRLPSVVHGIRPAALPPPGLLSRLGARGKTVGLTFSVVGYGFVENPDGGSGGFFPDGTRLGAHEGFVDILNAGWFETDTDPRHGFGGTCWGDSGAPLFLDSNTPDGRHIVVAVSSFTEGEVGGPKMCLGEPNFNARLDRVEALSFIASAGRSVEHP